MLGTLKQKQLVTTSVQGYLIKPLKRMHIWNTVSALCKKEKIKKQGSTRKLQETLQLQVLVAEDNIMNQKIIKSMVEKMGHACTVASNGMEAVAEFEKKEFDVIFMLILQGL